MKIRRFFLLCAVWFLAIAASAQTLPPPPVASITRIAKEAYPAAGIYCSSDREGASFEEFRYVAMDRTLVTVDRIKKCLTMLPKQFTRQDMTTLSLPAEDFRIAEIPGMVCLYVKMPFRLPQWKIEFTIPAMLKQERIEECFASMQKPQSQMPMSRVLQKAI